MINVMTVFRDDHGFIAEAIEYENGKVFFQWRVEPIAANLFKNREDMQSELDRRYPESKDETIIRSLDIDTTEGELVISPIEFLDLELLLEFLFGKQANRLKVFTIIRQADESGISGTGHVITGMVFSNGLTNLNWLSDKSSNSTFDSWEHFLSIHIEAHPNNDTIINELELETDNEGVIEVLEKDLCTICYEPIDKQLLGTGWTHRVFAKNFNHTAMKAGSERKPGESCDDCVSRKIPIIARENPDQDNDQNVAIAFSVCGCSQKEADRYKEKDFQLTLMLGVDLESIRDLQKETMPSAYPLDYWKVLYADPASLGFVIRKDNRLLGYIIGKRVEETIGIVGRLLSVAVNPGIQQKGIGKMLLETFTKAMKANGVSLINLEVREQNKSAIAFYKKHHFVQSGQQKNFYPNGDNVILMGKVL